jgi:hydrogenase-4 component F
MLLQGIVYLPLAAGAASLLLRVDAARRALLVAAALGHLGMTLAAAIAPPGPEWGGTLVLDALGTLFLCIASLLFLAASVYGVGYLSHEHQGERKDFQEKTVFVNAPEAVFTACLLFFLASMSLVCLSQHLGLIWVAVEATTLASAPLIYFHRHHRSLEACWKYLMICSVGIGLALLGNILLAASAEFGLAAPAHGEAPTTLAEFLRAAPFLEKSWFRAAFIFLVVGYGTKMGLAPLHTWLPDAHSESPSLVSALLSGALLNCAFLAILRTYQVGAAAGETAFCSSILVLFGLLSMAFAAVFILGQGDFKRILAYSSVEHMGILSLGVGLGGAAAFGSMLHAVSHSLTKAMLFLLAGNIMTVYHSKSSHDVRGVCRLLPVTGALWVAGFLAITGAPPFGLFMSEFTILKSALDSGRSGVAVAYLALLAVIFIGMATPVLRMARGESTPSVRTTTRGESFYFIGPPLVLIASVLLLGLYVPASLHGLLTQAARLLGGQ